MNIYSYKAVDAYLNTLPENTLVFMIPGSLVDNYIVFHEHAAAVEFFNEKYLNPWASGIARHVYRKRIPGKLFDFIRESVTDKTIDPEYADEILEYLEYFREKQQPGKAAENAG